MAASLVAGDRGFIETNLTQELRARRNEVWTSDIVHEEDPRHARASTSSYQQMELTFQSHKFDYAYHLAAEHRRWNGEDHYGNATSRRARELLGYVRSMNFDDGLNITMRWFRDPWDEVQPNAKFPLVLSPQLAVWW